MKRSSLKLGAGLVALMAVGAGGSQAVAQTRGAPSSGTATQLAFELAMAQVATTGDSAPAPAPAPATTSGTGRPKVAIGKDGLVDGGAYIEADQIERTDDDLVMAYGHVEMRYKGKTIRADQISYNSTTGVTNATGHTQTISDDGSVQFADSINYDDNMQSGVSHNFASLGADNAKIFARRVEQLNPDTNELTDVIYTPCQLCVKKGETQDPSWSIEASKITQRKDKHMVYYHNAMVKLHGVPIFYTPYLWTPDPDLDRASGFLQPKITFGKKRGFSYEQPYLWSISKYQELLISPQLNASVNPLLNMEYSRHFYSGILHARFGFTNESFFDNKGNRIGPSETRDYILADGAFDINEKWRWSFTAQSVKDPYEGGGDYANFFERYNIDSPFKKVGDLTVDSRQLINQINLTRQVDNAYLSVTMASFQGLQPRFLSTDTERLQPLAANSDLYPVIAPMIEGYWSPRSRILGGQMTLSLNAIGLQHKAFPSSSVSDIFPNAAAAPLPIDATLGFDTARASVGFNYTGDMTTKGGIKWGPFLDLRHDYYHETDLVTRGDSVNISRDLGTAGFNVSYPLYRKSGGLTTIVEPIAQLAVSPDAQISPYLPNEDSQSVSFDDTTLFQVNKSPGFDIYEGGARLNLGVRTQFILASGWHFDSLIGRTLRDKPETQYLRTLTHSGKTYIYDPTGIGRQNSDWIIDGSFDSGKGLYGYTRMRLDSETTRLSQGEFGLSVKTDQTVATVRYIFNDLLATPVVVNNKLVRFGDNYRNMQIYGRHFFTDNWGVSARLDRDLIQGAWRRSTVSLIYRNDCIWYEFIYERNDTNLYRQDGKPTSSFLFSLHFATLGSSSSDFTDVR